MDRGLEDSPRVAAAGVLEAQSCVEDGRLGTVKRGGEHETVGAAGGGPALDGADERAADAAAAHVRRNDERRELHDRVRVVEDVARMHRREPDDAPVGDSDERLRIAASAEAREPRGNVRRSRGITEVAEQLGHGRRVVIARGADVDHFRMGATVARQIA